MEEVNVKFLSDTRDYISGTDDATESTERLGDSIMQVNSEQVNLTDTASTSATAIDGLGRSFDTTAAGAIDAQLGVSGLGDAVVSTGKSALTALKGLRAFNTAMLVTVGGAIVLGLVALVVYWEDISKAIGLTKEELIDYNAVALEAAETNLTLLDLQERTLRLAGENEEANKARVNSLEVEVLIAKNAVEALDEQILKTTELGISQEVAIGLVEEYAGEYAVLTARLGFAEAALNAFNDSLNNVDTGEAIIKLSDVVKQIAEAPEPIGLEQTIDETIDAYILEWDNAFAKVRQAGIEFKADEEAEKLRITLEAIEAERKARVEAAEELAIIEEQRAQQSVANAGLIFAAINSFNQENRELAAALAIGEAGANAAVAVMKAVSIYPPGTPSSVLLPGSLVAIGAVFAAQVGNIVSSLGAGGSGVSPTSGVQTVSRASLETALPQNLTPTNALVPVLVTSDFNTVNNRVRVTESRGSLA